MSQSPSSPLSGGRGVYKEEEGARTKRSREGLHRRAQSIPTRQVMVWCASSWLSHPGSMVEGQQISQSWDAWRSESILLKLVPRILIRACSSISHISESALTETVSKEWWGGLQFPTVTFISNLFSVTEKVALSTYEYQIRWSLQTLM